MRKVRRELKNCVRTETLHGAPWLDALHGRLKLSRWNTHSFFSRLGFFFTINKWILLPDKGQFLHICARFYTSVEPANFKPFLISKYILNPWSHDSWSLSWWWTSLEIDFPDDDRTKTFLLFSQWRLHRREDCRGSVAGPVTTPCAFETAGVAWGLKDWLTEMPHCMKKFYSIVAHPQDQT